MTGLGQYSVVGRRALQFALSAICFSLVLPGAPYAQAQQNPAALRTSAALANAGTNAVPDAPMPLLSLAQTADRGASKSPG